MSIFKITLKWLMFTLTDIDECASSPCQNEGTCGDTSDGYVCLCKAGYAGTRCEQGK